MKRLILAISVLAFLACSCRSGKDLNIYVDHSKEKNKYQTASSKKKYKSAKKCPSWKKGK